MSMFSGRYDLKDAMAGLGGWMDASGAPVEFGEGTGPYYSDEMLDFIEFKKRTGGVLHQHKKVKVNEYNQDEIAAHCAGLKIIEHYKNVQDKRFASGERLEREYSYEYYGKEYSLKELNKHGVYVTTDIHFDTLLDLIPYYPYGVAAEAYNDGKAYIVISNESEVARDRDTAISNGRFDCYWEHYAKNLQDHYREVVLKHFDPRGREVVKEVTFDERGVGSVGEAIDCNFEPEWRWSDGKTHCHWSGPKLIDPAAGTIEMSETDLKHYLGNKALVYYVAKK